MPHAESTSKRAFVTGATGQDGYYLCRLLLTRGFVVTAGVRDPTSVRALSLSRDLPKLRLVPFDLLDPRSIASSLADAAPDQVCHLAGESSVTASWQNPSETLQVNTLGTQRLIESVRSMAPEAHFIFAGSGDCYDHAAAGPQGITPQTPLLSTSPYAVSKSAATQLLQCYRNQFGLRISVAILMNHTSPRRPSYFVERKIVSEAVEVKRGLRDKVCLGSLETHRDWSWAEDIVEGLALMASQGSSDDFVLASGISQTTGDWVRLTFDRLGLNERDHLQIDPNLLHQGDRRHTCGDIRPARERLGWNPKTNLEEIVARLIDAELESKD